MTAKLTNKKRLALVLLPFLCILLLVLSSRTSTEATAAEPLGRLQKRSQYPLTLPAGGQILLQQEGRILFMGAHIPPNSSRQVVLFDSDTRQPLWTAALPGSAIQAAALPGGDYAVVTVRQKGSAHLLRLDGQSGATRWDTAYPNPALDILWDEAEGRLLVSDGASLWTVSTADGSTLERLADSLGDNPHPESVSLARSASDPHRLYLASDTLLTAVRLQNGQSSTEWRFNSAKFIVQLLPVRFTSGETGVVALAHSHAYFVSNSGKMVWHIANQDINYGAVALPQAQAARWVAFGNFVNGLYLTDAQGERAHQALPGGNVRVLGIPLPIPRNVLLGGVFAAPASHDAFPGFLLAVRSLEKVFAYQATPDGELSFLAEAAIAPQQAGGTLIQQSNENPNYPPFALEGGLAVTGPEGIVLFTLMPR